MLQSSYKILSWGRSLLLLSLAEFPSRILEIFFKCISLFFAFADAKRNASLDSSSSVRNMLPVAVGLPPSRKKRGRRFHPF